MPTQPRKSTAAKKTTAKRAPAARQSDSPSAPAVNFDTWNRGDEIEPFVIVVGGNRYVSQDPALIDYRDLMAGIEDPTRMFEALFPDEHEEILANTLPVGAIATFAKAIETHFGLEDFVSA